MISPFQINVADLQVADLQRRLENIIWPHAIANSGWDYGAELKTVKEFCNYWKQQLSRFFVNRTFNAAA